MTNPQHESERRISFNLNTALLDLFGSGEFQAKFPQELAQKLLGNWSDQELSIIAMFRNYASQPERAIEAYSSWQEAMECFIESYTPYELGAAARQEPRPIATLHIQTVASLLYSIRCSRLLECAGLLEQAIEEYISSAQAIEGFIAQNNKVPFNLQPILNQLTLKIIHLRWL